MAFSRNWIDLMKNQSQKQLEVIMFKSLLNLFIFYCQVTIWYLIFGATILIVFDIEIPLPLLVLLTWIIAPVVSTKLSFLSTKYLNINRAKPYIVVSFTLNLLIILIYTWIESRRPYIDGDFMDFRGLIFLVYGIGQIVGIVFSILFKEKVVLKKEF